LVDIGCMLSCEDVLRTPVSILVRVRGLTVELVLLRLLGCGGLRLILNLSDLILQPGILMSIEFVR
jgi:hypothetical protein